MKIFNSSYKIAFLLFLGFVSFTSATAQNQITEDFESGWGIWNDGGSDAMRLVKINDNPNGQYCIRLRDNSGQNSSTYTNNLDLSSASQATITFSYEAESMEPGEDFLLEFSADGGNTFQTIKSYFSGVDFQNGQVKTETVVINESFTTTTVFRFRCDASSNYDIVFIDDVSIISGAGGGTTYDCSALDADIGDSCNDGNPNTNNDIVTPSCVCVGTPSGTVYDCPALNADIGDSCNDGNPNTINDSINADCQCSGSITAPVECSGKITCLKINRHDNTSNYLSSINGAEYCSDLFSSNISIRANVAGSHQSMSITVESPEGVTTALDNTVGYDSYMFNASTPGIYKVYAKLYSQDNRGGMLCDQSHVYFTVKACGPGYDCPALNANIGDYCNDNDPNTINDSITANCQCEGTPVTGCNHTLLHYQGFETDLGLWEDGGSDCVRLYEPGPLTVGDYCIRLRDDSGMASSLIYKDLNLQGATECKIDFMYLAESMENGEDFFLEYSIDNSPYTVLKNWVAGTDFTNGNKISESISFVGNFTSNTKLRFRCDASSNYDFIYLDEIFVYSCSGGGTTYDCPTLNANIGESCDDGNQNTTNDIIMANCICEGTPIGPIYDCPALSANIGESCNDNNPNTNNDIITPSCACQGTPITGCNHQLVDYQGFETGMGIWNDGGSDCLRLYEPGAQTTGDYCIRLRDNSGNASSLITDPLNFIGVTECKIDFMFLPESMETGEDFLLEYSNDGGLTYNYVQRWIAGVDFQNNVKRSVSIFFSGNFSSNTTLRFRCDASSNYDIVYLDEIQIYACGGAWLDGADSHHSTARTSELSDAPQGIENSISSKTFLSVYPNPVAGQTLFMNIETAEDTILKGTIYSQYGEVILNYADHNLDSGSNVHKIDLADISSGAYILRIEIGIEVFFEQIIVVR